MKTLLSLTLFLLVSSIGYNRTWDDISEENQIKDCECASLSSRFIDKDTAGRSTKALYSVGIRALLASRFNTLEDLKEIIQIEYSKDNSSSENTSDSYSKVLLRHCSHGLEVTSVLESGLTQGDIMNAGASSYLGQALFVLKAPFAIANREDLRKIYILARRKDDMFGEGDVAFYDLAEGSANNISTSEMAYQNPRDSSEKGYINSFNHITAQAIITSCFSEELADFLADVHERHHMPELTSGKFSEQQLTDPENDPMDNYVDMVNNEWGQVIGKKLRKKFNINRETFWTPQLLANYLNEIQYYYSWAFQIGFNPFRPKDELIIKYSNKMNIVMQGRV